MPRFVGINSGSCVDSIDAVVIDIDLGQDGLPTKPTVVHAAEYDWPEILMPVLIEAIDGKLDVHAVSRLNFAVGHAFGLVALNVVAEAGLTPADIEAIGVDGQTLSMAQPQRELLTGDDLADYLTGHRGHTLQAGDGAVIAATADIDVVTRFRPADIALGGNGAPIEQFLDYVLYRDIAPAVTLNIGGIANIHAITATDDGVIAFDTGPGNILLDRFMTQRFGMPYDRDGAAAASGTVATDVLAHLMQHPFLQRIPPRSAWREDFDENYLAHVLATYPDVSDNDMAATITEFTVQAILEALGHVPFLADVKLLIGNGGGLLNPTIRSSIARQLPTHMKLVLSDEFGIPAKGNEAAKFATLAFAHLHRLKGNFPSSSGASRQAVLGQHHLRPSA